jgi:DNA-binding response OmpR family regulator
MAKILVVEDDSEFAAMVHDTLEADRHLVDLAEDGQMALDMLATYQYDLIVLDWNVPEVSGLEICRKLRARGESVPVLMLTSNASLDHKESGFDNGADDYVTKPVHPRELTARVRALLRRPAALTGNMLKVRDIELDCLAHTVKRDGIQLNVLPREFAVLEFLLKNAGRVFSQEELLDRVWSTDAAVTLDTVRTCIRRIRDKVDVEGQSSIIRTVYSVGYAIDPD